VGRTQSKPLAQRLRVVAQSIGNTAINGGLSHEIGYQIESHIKSKTLLYAQIAGGSQADSAWTQPKNSA
jgi:hypothetical protein